MKALRILLLLSPLLTGACTTIGYYGQSLAGQMEVMRKQHAVDTIWCYLIIGCTNYRGYFNQQQADTYADVLKRQGWEVSVNGISAYSTLGWLRDPLLNTMINRENWEIARLLFHELAHQIIYVADDTEFNEAFADAVAGIGLDRWLREHHPGQIEAVHIALEREAGLYRLLLTTRDEFDRLYQSSQPTGAMREQKALLHEQLQRQYIELKQQWNGDNRYDHWIQNRVNNASLLALSTYRSLVPAFEAAFRLYQDDLPRFYEWAEKLAACDKAGRQSVLQHPTVEFSCGN